MTYPSICIWVDIAPKREKIAEKCIFSLCSIENVISKYQNGVFVDVKHDSSDVKKAKSMKERKRSERGREKEENSGGRKSGEPISCVCVRARFPTAMLFFCCHKCHTCDNKGGKIVRKDKKNEEHFGKKSTRKSRIFRCRLACFWKIVSIFLLKYVGK